MSITKLATALTVIFIISAGVLITELLFLLRRRRSLRLRSPQQPHHSPNNLLHFCLKSHTQVEPSGRAPTETPEGPNGNGSSPEDPVIDVFKLLEANGPSRFLCTIKEDESEYVESASMIGVEVAPDTKEVSLQACFEAEAAEEKEVKVEVVTVVSSPCDSPMFFTPVGSPSRMGGSS